VPGSRVSRRSLLRAGRAAALLAAGAVGAGIVDGCDLDPRSSSRPAARPPADPDQQVVEAARAELAGLIVRLAATPGTAALVACHRQQLEALQGSMPRLRRRRPLSRSQVVDRERRASQRFRRWALACQDGDLARLLASVAAGISMQPVFRTPS
jgi:hypothetical protein